MEKILTSQTFKINSGFLTSFGMTPEGVFPQTVKPAPALGGDLREEACFEWGIMGERMIESAILLQPAEHEL